MSGIQRKVDVRGVYGSDLVISTYRCMGMRGVVGVIRIIVVIITVI